MRIANRLIQFTIILIVTLLYSNNALAVSYTLDLEVIGSSSENKAGYWHKQYYKPTYPLTGKVHFMTKYSGTYSYIISICPDDLNESECQADNIQYGTSTIVSASPPVGYIYEIILNTPIQNEVGQTYYFLLSLYGTGLAGSIAPTDIYSDGLNFLGHVALDENFTITTSEAQDIFFRTYTVDDGIYFERPYTTDRDFQNWQIAYQYSTTLSTSTNQSLMINIDYDYGSSTDTDWITNLPSNSVYTSVNIPKEFTLSTGNHIATATLILVNSSYYPIATSALMSTVLNFTIDPAALIPTNIEDEEYCNENMNITIKPFCYLFEYLFIPTQESRNSLQTATNEIWNKTATPLSELNLALSTSTATTTSYNEISYNLTTGGYAAEYKIFSVDEFENYFGQEAINNFRYLMKILIYGSFAFYLFYTIINIYSIIKGKTEKQ